MIQYILESAFCLACLYAFYWVALRRETFFQWNRAYLLVSPLLALGLPLLKIRLESHPRESLAPATSIDLPLLVGQVQTAPVAVRHTLSQPVAQGWSLSLGEVLWWVYLAGAGLLAIGLAIKMWYLWRMIRRCRRAQAGDIEVSVSDADPLPLASFFGYIFWNKNIQSPEKQRLLLEHELVHVRQWHSLDVLLMEAMVVMYWFNPFIHAFRRSLCVMHEYIADDHVVRLTRQRYEYASLLVQSQQAGRQKQPGLVNTFHSLIKNRLVMLARRPSRPFYRLKYALALPLFAALMLLFSFRLIEKLPAAAAFRDVVQTVEKYAGTLQTFTISEQPTTRAEPTVYNFYWGSIQCKIYYEVVSDTYSGEADISPEEFREALKREPRIWNGQSLEQHVSFSLGHLTIRSDYNNESVYAARRKELEDFSAGLHRGDYLLLEKLVLPNGKMATVRLSLNTEAADWVKSLQSGSINWPENPDISFEDSPRLTWGKADGLQYSPDRQFYTVREFWEILQSDPTARLPEGTSRQEKRDTTTSLLWSDQLLPDRMRLMVVMPGNNILIKINEETLTMDQVRASLEAKREQIQPGIVVLIHWAAPNPAEMSWPNASVSASFTLVPDGDPRLMLRRGEQNNYRLAWGDFTGAFLKQYACRFRAPGQEDIMGDRPVQIENHSLTAKEIIQMCRLKPRFFQNDQAIELQQFVIEHKGHSISVGKEGVEEDFIRFLERGLRPGDVLRLTGFKAFAGTSRQITGLWQNLSMHMHHINTTEVEVVEVNPTQSADYKLVRFIVSEQAHEALRQRLGNQRGIFFQQGDVDLTHAVIVLEVRSDDPKPPLRKAGEAHQQYFNLSITPNPATDKITFHFDLPQAGRGRLSIANAMGQEVYSLETDYQAGQGSYPVFTRDLKSAGVFFATLEMPYGKATQQFLVQ
ncbi:MAG: hypothetical protein EPGJADBJ_01293 [Saprospiraceae bacterium]|nr:hypothetical protein [Saprospiraceae bacterium]